jgi:GDP-4-dehydro-6-deoxy-D-mannose reductase
MDGMKRALITGVNGFVGTHLASLLNHRGYEVSGVDQAVHPSVADVDYSHVSILDASGLARLLQRLQPDEVYHLAAISYPPDADTSPVFALQTNIIGTVSVLDAVKTACPEAVSLLVGSSKQYGDVALDQPVSEDLGVNPVSFYGISKFSSELVGRQYLRQFGLDVRFTRSFNHTGPGQSPHFVCSDWARQAAEIALKKRNPIMQVGDLRIEIDFTDVRDVVAAYGAIVESGQPGEVYNVCSSDAIPLRHVLDHLIAKAGVPIEVTTAERKLSAHTTSPRLIGNNWKLTSQTGWKPTIPIARTLDDLFEYWMHRLND